ncbi:MAG: hypothetical protein ACOC78_02670, partial [Actinomycetota bacterium]
REGYTVPKQEGGDVWLASNEKEPEEEEDLEEGEEEMPESIVEGAGREGLEDPDAELREDTVSDEAE